MSHRSLESPCQLLRIEGSIAILTYKDITIDLETAKMMAAERLAFYDGNSYPTLADIRDVKMVTKEARDFFATGDGIKGIPAGAILTGSYITVFIANLYLRFSKPKMPTRAFKTKENALKWLRQFVKI